jgi:integrase
VRPGGARSPPARMRAVPSFAAEVLRQRLVLIAGEEPEHLVFFSRNHTPLTTNNVRRRLRAVLDEAGIAGVTPHSFRRTVATVIDRAGGAHLAAENTWSHLLGDHQAALS